MDDAWLLKVEQLHAQISKLMIRVSDLHALVVILIVCVIVWPLLLRLVDRRGERR